MIYLYRFPDEIKMRFDSLNFRNQDNFSNSMNAELYQESCKVFSKGLGSAYFINMTGLKYHQKECYMCCFCRLSLLNWSSFTGEDGNVYCEEHKSFGASSIFKTMFTFLAMILLKKIRRENFSFQNSLK
jgi:hypothetical protein